MSRLRKEDKYKAKNISISLSFNHMEMLRELELYYKRRSSFIIQLLIEKAFKEFKNGT